MSNPFHIATVLLLASWLAGCGDAESSATETGSASGAGESQTSGSSGPNLAALNARLPVVGQPLPAIVGRTLGGERVDNDSLHGRTVLLNLWFVH